MNLNETNNKVFKNFDVLTNRYIPPDFKHREEQIREIKNRLMPFFTFDFCENTIWLEGRPGLGKTHIVKHILKDEDNFYLKPSKQSTCHSLFFGFIREYDLGKAHPRDEIGAYFNLFENAIKDKTAIMVIDDTQFLATKDPTELDRVLFYLSRLDNVQLILIGNKPIYEISSKLQPATVDGMKTRPIFFPKYNVDQLQDILQQRADHAFYKEACPRGVINYVAARGGSEWGSARYALDILIEAGCNAINENKDKIGQEDVDTAIHQLELTVFKTKIKLLPPSVFAFLEGLYRHRDQKIITTGQAIEYYNEVCNEADIYPIKERKLKDIMAELQEDGLISRTLQSLGRERGCTHIIKWMIPENIYNEVKAELAASSPFSASEKSGEAIYQRSRELGSVTN